MSDNSPCSCNVSFRQRFLYIYNLIHIKTKLCSLGSCNIWPRINDPPSIVKCKSLFSQWFLKEDNRSCTLGHDHKICNIVSSSRVQKEHNFVSIFPYLKRVTLVVRIYWFILYYYHSNLELLVHLKGSSYNFYHWSSVIANLVPHFNWPNGIVCS